MSHDNDKFHQIEQFLIRLAALILLALALFKIVASEVKSTFPPAREESTRPIVGAPASTAPALHPGAARDP